MFLKYIIVFYIFFTFFLTKYPAFYSIAKYSEFYCRSQQNIFFHTLANLSVTDAHSATFLAIVANLQINRYSSFFFTSQKKSFKNGAGYSLTVRNFCRLFINGGCFVFNASTVNLSTLVKKVGRYDAVKLVKSAVIPGFSCVYLPERNSKSTRLFIAMIFHKSVTFYGF